MLSSRFRAAVGIGTSRRMLLHALTGRLLSGHLKKTDSGYQLWVYQRSRHGLVMMGCINGSLRSASH